MESISNYSSSVLALGGFGLLYFAQLLILDVAGLRAKHEPGSVIDGGHDDFLFRANRAHANTTESVGILILFALFAILGGADPTWTARALWAYVVARSLHAICYYLNIKALRSVAFALSLAALGSLFGIGIITS